MIYLDHAASTPMFDEAIDELKRSYKEDYANSAGAHKLARELNKRVDTVRENFMDALSASAEYDFVFCSSATEANNTIIKGLDLSEGQGILTSKAEHASVVMPSLHLKNTQGIEWQELPLNANLIYDVELTLKSIQPNTRLLCMGHVISQSGSLSPVMEIAKVVKQNHPKIHIHVDAVQSFGKVDIDLKGNYIDSMSISAHKMGGPKGISGFFINKKARLNKLLHGGEHELGYRASTVSAPLIFSWKKALDRRMAVKAEAFTKVSEINKFVRTTLANAISEIHFPNNIEFTSAYTIFFILPNFPGDMMVRHMEEKGIMVSTKSACSSKIKGKSDVLEAMHIPENQHKNVIRMSFSHSTKMEDVEEFCKHFIAMYKELKAFMI